MDSITYRLNGITVKENSGAIMLGLGSQATEDDALQFIRIWNLRFHDSDAVFNEIEDFQDTWQEVYAAAFPENGYN